MEIGQYLDSTYLKTAVQANISEEATRQNVVNLVNEAIENNFKLVMIRPKFVTLANEMIQNSNSKVVVGTVIGFHEGTYSTDEKLKEAQQAIDDDVDELHELEDGED